LKRLIGKKVQFLIEGVGKRFDATVIADYPDRVAVRDEEDRVVFIIKSKIALFRPLEPFSLDSEDSVCVLFCRDPSRGCNGVKYMHKGGTAKNSDFDLFMSPCPMKAESCKRGSHGDIRSCSKTSKAT